MGLRRCWRSQLQAGRRYLHRREALHYDRYADKCGAFRTDTDPKHQRTRITSFTMATPKVPNDNATTSSIDGTSSSQK